MKPMKQFSIGLMLFASLLFFSYGCKKDSNNDLQGSMRLEITDAPIDDANIQGAFVTIAEVKVDGKAVTGFSGKKTVNLYALQNGQTEVLGDLQLEAGTYSNITLVLDHASDANGNSPGCYVLTTDNVKHSLQATASTTQEIVINSSPFEVTNGQTSNLVIDFDLRKTIRYEDNSSTDDKYDFVTDSEIQSGVRLVAKNKAGTIKGQCEDNLGIAEKIVVYAYKKGTYNKETEVNGQGSSKITFKNCVSSATVDAQGNYTLAFLEEGDYELHFMAYEDSDADGTMELKGELALSLTGGLSLDLSNISVQSESQVTAAVLVTGLIP